MIVISNRTELDQFAAECDGECVVMNAIIDDEHKVLAFAPDFEVTGKLVEQFNIDSDWNYYFRDESEGFDFARFSL